MMGVRVTRWAWVLLLFLTPLSMGAATFTPVAPDANDGIVARIEYMNPGCAVTATTVVVATTVRTTLAMTDCFFVIPFPQVELAPFGPLPAGTYTYEVYYTVEGGPPEILSSQPLVVVSAPGATGIPTLSPALLLALAATLGILGAVTLRRY